MSQPQEDTAPVLALGGRLSRPISIIGFSFACILLAVIGGATFAGYRAGVAQRESQFRATQVIELKVQFDLGTTDLAAGRHEIAAERFAYILSIDPSYPGAAENLAAARAALRATATPTPTPAATPTPVLEDPAEIFALALQYSRVGDWNGVITQLAILHAVDPDYEAVRADGLLFTALRNRGVQRIQGDEMEAGIFDLDQASAFGPLDTEAINYRAWARLYLNAQSYWGVNWQQTVQILKLLYNLAPNFRDTTLKYYQATLRYAEQLDAAGDYCGAADEYATAQRLFTDQTVAAVHATAQANCLQTPTPESTEGGAPDQTPTPGGDEQGSGTPTPTPAP